ncbi:hypothetical protein PMV_130 [Port-miou virus]|uniref:MORN repeat-containing protein n=1 Tax=Port-miou virus TaxID=1733873 RepID=A0A0N9PW58_9VIRU|nr:hypothetical protein PMV_130 [Port-miou virus]
MQNPLFEEQEEQTRVAYGAKKFHKNPESFTYTKSFLLPNGEKHGTHKVSRTFPAFDGETIVETSEWSRGVLNGPWEAVSSKGGKLVGNFVNGKAQGNFVMEKEGRETIILDFVDGFVRKWRFGRYTKLRFRWTKKKLIIIQPKNICEFKVKLPKNRKTKKEDKVGNILLFCLSLYGRTLLNSKGEPFVVGFEDEVFRIPCFPDELNISDLLPKKEGHDTIFCRTS